MTKGVHLKTYNAYFNRKSTWMQEFLLFFQNKAGQGRGVGPVGKIAHQYGIFFQRESPQPAEESPGAPSPRELSRQQP